MVQFQSDIRQVSRTLRAALTTLLVFALVVPRIQAQEGGTVTGRVVAAGSGEPLASTQVYIAGTGIGTLTNSSARFLLLNVPEGEHQVRVERIGYTSMTQRVTVRAGQATDVLFQLQEEVLGLDGIVVTGTAGAARRREVGNSLSEMNVAQMDEPMMSVDAILQARSPGIQVTEQNGQVGGGAKIRLRGNVSAAMSNQPLVYIDGIRIRSEGLPKNVGTADYSGRGPNIVYGPLNDLDPGDIERVEVIKGAAATTLYGTEAAAGVIQIFTKRGKVGAARWEFETDQGFAKLGKFGPTEDFRGRPLVVPASEDQVAPFGVPDDPSYMFIEPYLRNAYRQKYALSVSGGVEDLSYFLAGSYTDAQGVLPNDLEEKFSMRGNFSASPIRNLALDWRTSYARTDLEQTPSGPSAQGIILNTFRRANNYVGGKTDYETMMRVIDYENPQRIERFITGLTGLYAPSSAISGRMTVGYDVVNQSTASVRPYGYILVPQGIAHANEFQNTTLTLDVVGTWSTNLIEKLTSSFSFGGQSVTTEEHRVDTYGETFPGPGKVTVSSASTRVGFETKLRVINAGFFAQEMLGWQDRYFLTLGLRMDGNSSFGEDLGLEAYPKASFSWVLSDEDFWDEGWGQVKLRAAWGQSGRAPGAFDAVRTWNPIGWGGLPAFRPSNLGNPELGPERTSEIEGGLDGSFLNNRLEVGMTYYHQKTTDALFQVSQIPSTGFLGSQLKNVGKLENSGLELSVNSTLLDRSDWGLELGGSVTTNKSKVLDLGGATEFGIGGNGFIAEGHPVPVVRGRCISNADQFEVPKVQLGCNYGPNLPTLMVGLNTQIRLPYGLLVSARGEYQGGHYAYNVNDGEALTRGVRWPNCFNYYPAIDAWVASGRKDATLLNDVNALERARCISSYANRDFAIYPQDFFKVREISVGAPLPFDLPRAQSARVVVSARNAIRWRKAKYNFADPETSGGFGFESTGMTERTQTTGGGIPTPAFYTFSLRMTF